MTRSTWIAAFSMIAAAVVFMTCAFAPGMRSISETLAQLNAKRSFILDAQKLRRVTEQTRCELENTLAYNAKQGTQILTQSDLPVLYGQISQITKSYDAATQKFEPRPPVAYESFHKITIGLGIAGSFSAIHHLVRDLEALPARIWIDEMQIRGPRENGKPVECDMTLVVFIDNPEKND
ncbi:MAG: type 4a pilus biogenesis protein PilO [Planctomycetia bacterium]|nr:type 4a pilus biogenesis protein PilO [Planctomycetia bacterium]